MPSRTSKVHILGKVRTKASYSAHMGGILMSWCYFQMTIPIAMAYLVQAGRGGLRSAKYLSPSASEMRRSCPNFEVQSPLKRARRALIGKNSPYVRALQ